MQKERVINIDAIIIIVYRSCFIIISNAFLKICASHPKTLEQTDTVYKTSTMGWLTRRRSCAFWMKLYDVGDFLK